MTRIAFFSAAAIATMVVLAQGLTGCEQQKPPAADHQQMSSMTCPCGAPGKADVALMMKDGRVQHYCGESCAEACIEKAGMTLDKTCACGHAGSMNFMAVEPDGKTAKMYCGAGCMKAHAPGMQH